MFRIKSTKYNTYFSGGKSVKNPHYKVTIPEPETRWIEDKVGWEIYYNKIRKRNAEYEAAKRLAAIEPDNVEAHIELMKTYNVPHDYLKFSHTGKVFDTRRGAEVKLSNLTKTSKKIRSKTASQVLYGNELSTRWKVVEGRLVDVNEAENVRDSKKD